MKTVKDFLCPFYSVSGSQFRFAGRQISKAISSNILQANKNYGGMLSVIPYWGIFLKKLLIVE
jgi:hypothetical protein